MANKSKGYVYLARSIQDNFIWNDPEPFDHRSAWIDLILMANHAEKALGVRGTPITIQRGQLLTSVPKLAKKWHWSENKVRRFLGTLSGQGMAQVNGSARGTLVSLVNYDFYQVPWYTDGSANGSADGSADGSARGTQTINKRNKINKYKSVAPPEPDKKDIRVWQ